MLDRRLGMLCWLIRIIVVAYVALYVFIVCEGYTSTEKGVGWTISQVNGTTFSYSNGQPRPWDAVDAVQPALEDGAAFIATEVYYTPQQQIGNCSSWSKPCTTGADCPSAPPLSTGTCSNNYCQGPPLERVCARFCGAVQRTQLWGGGEGGAVGGRMVETRRDRTAGALDGRDRRARGRKGTRLCPARGPGVGGRSSEGGRARGEGLTHPPSRIAQRRGALQHRRLTRVPAPPSQRCSGAPRTPTRASSARSCTSLMGTPTQSWAFGSRRRSCSRRSIRRPSSRRSTRSSPRSPRSWITITPAATPPKPSALSVPRRAPSLAMATIARPITSRCVPPGRPAV